jgi:hypothetical protein
MWIWNIAKKKFKKDTLYAEIWRKKMRIPQNFTFPLIYVCLYEKACLELCGVFRNASLV